MPAAVDRVAGGAIAVFAGLLIYESVKLPLGSLRNPGPGGAPLVLGVILLACGLVLVATGGASPRLAGLGWVEWRHAVAIFAVCAFAAVALERIGYRLTTATALLFLLAVVERKTVVLALAVALALSLGSYFLFATLLRVPLPRGPLGF